MNIFLIKILIVFLAVWLNMIYICIVLIKIYRKGTT